MKTPIKIYLITFIAAAGLVAGCNRSIESASQDFNSLPTAVQKSIRAQAPNGEIASISKTTENGLDAYKVEFRQEGKNSTMLVASDGRVLSSDMPEKQNGIVKDVQRALTPTGAVGTKFSALPEKAQKTILAHAPETEIADISRHEDNGRVIYEVSFKDTGKNPTIKVADDGTLVQDLQK
jgi:uncharacterized membrane protein YkoI